MNTNYRKDVFTVERIIREAKKGSIWFEHPIKEESGQWSDIVRSNFISDILQQNFIPDIVFVKKELGSFVCVDGKQRFMSIRDFVNDEYRIDHNVERYMIEYFIPVFDYDRKLHKDNNGFAICQKHECDIRRKRFKDLPKELQERFLEYCFNVTVIDCCSKDDVIYHIKRFNAKSVPNTTDTQLCVEKELEKFKKENELLRKKLEVLEKKYSGLGRKERFDDDGKKKIMNLRAEGYSIDKIKDIMQCSKGLVHKIIKEYNE